VAVAAGDRIPVGARFSATVQTGPGTHPASYTMGTGSFPGVKRPGRGVDDPPHLAPRLKNRVELYCYVYLFKLLCIFSYVFFIILQFVL
jgi:hypothetical protein